METKQFYYIEHPCDRLQTGAIGKIIPILWCNKGLYGILPIEKVENMIQLMQDKQHIPILENFSTGGFHWDEVEIIDPSLARLLLQQ